MQGVQKIKCVSCGTMFMSETRASKCPTCAEGGHHHHHGGESGMGGGCGCGHSH